MEASPHRPRRDVLGFLKSVVEFFTGVTGLATAALGILGTVAAFALAAPGPTPATSEPATPTSREDADIRREWAQAVSQECEAVVLVGLGAVESGDPTAFVADLRVFAGELRAGPTPSGFEDEAASAADDFDAEADAVAAGDPLTAQQRGSSGAAILREAGVTDC